MGKFHEYLAGKRVVVVGPAPILVGRNTGKEIDAFDVVVKTGPAILIDSIEYFADYGRRCDVLYMNATFCRNLPTPPIHNMKSRGLKFVRARINLENLIRPLAVHFDVHVLEADFINKIFLDSLALMGTIAILDILKAPVQELHITGFDFNTSRGPTMKQIDVPGKGNYGEYVTGYVDPIKKDMDFMRVQKDAHNHVNDTRLIKQLHGEGKITMPNYVEEKMNLLLSLAATGE